MAKSKQIGLRLEHNDVVALSDLAKREGRTEQDILRDSLHSYLKRAQEQTRFIESVERGWYELHSGLGEVVAEDDGFFDTVRRDIDNESTST